MENDNIVHELRVGTTLAGGKYIIERVIGSGGFGITYYAKHTLFNEHCAIKEFFIDGKCVRHTGNLTVHTQGAGKELFEKYRQKFIEEAQTLKKLDHPYIVKVMDVFEENGTSYIVMPFIKGKTLTKIVEEKGKLDYPEAVNYIGQLGEAVDYIHKKGILHRDIKPDNIIVTPDNNIVLLDFGSAREFVEDKTQSHTSILTQGYAPLEQYSNVSRKGSYTDIYAMGGVFYYVLTGKKPIDATSRAIEKMPSPKELVPSIPEDASRTVMKAMQLKSENRHQTVKDFMDDLLGKRISTLVDETMGAKKHAGKTILWSAIGVAALFVIGLLIFNANKQPAWLNGQVEDIVVYPFNDPLDKQYGVITTSVYIQPNRSKAEYYEILGEGKIKKFPSLPRKAYRPYTYYGQMQNGYPNGEGKAYDDVSSYFGYFKNGLRDGYGERIYTGAYNGIVYKGNYRQGKASGQGEIRWADGMVYNGNWENDQYNGFGTLTMPDGTVYRGIFENDNFIKERSR